MVTSGPWFRSLDPCTRVVRRIVSRLTGVLQSSRQLRDQLAAGAFSEQGDYTALAALLERFLHEALEPAVAGLTPYANRPKPLPPGRRKREEPEQLVLESAAYESANRRDRGLALTLLRGNRPQLEMAQACGISVSCWSLYESGRRKLRTARLPLALAALGSSLQDYELLVLQIRQYRLMRERLLLRLREATTAAQVAAIEAKLARLEESKPTRAPERGMSEAA